MLKSNGAAAFSGEREWANKHRQNWGSSPWSGANVRRGGTAERGQRQRQMPGTSRSEQGDPLSPSRRRRRRPPRARSVFPLIVGDLSLVRAVGAHNENLPVGLGLAVE